MGNADLRSIEVAGFQSLRRVTVPLRRFIVITGPSGSGKSALFRALRLLARNARGTSYITAGCTSCSVSAGGDSWAVRIMRSNAPRGRNEYVTARQEDGAWTSARSTKLAGQVPADARDLLALSDLNFARQLDLPYLLGESGAEIARRLGDLTNVSLVFGAAGEANRVRKQVARDLEAARQRRSALLAEAQQFAGLGQRRAAVRAAGEALARAQAAAGRAERLASLIGRLEQAEAAGQAARAAAAQQAPPPMTVLEQSLGRYLRLSYLARSLALAEQDAARLRGAAQQAAQQAQAARDGVHAALAAAGHCPVCGQATA